MAAHTLITELSRRTILASGTAVLAASMTTALPVAATAMPMPAVRPVADRDAEPLRRIAEARRLGADYLRAQRVRRRLREAMRDHPDNPRWLVTRRAHDMWQEIGEQVGYWPADAQCWKLFHRYADAVRAVMVTPVRTPGGLHAKISLGMKVARTGDLRVYMYEDREWLELALADLERMAQGVAA